MFFGGLPIQKDEEYLKTHNPQIVVGTPGRILALVRNKKLNLSLLKHFILDECDKMLEQLEMRRDVQEIFRSSPHTKQVMMFSATLSKEIRPVCKKFMHDVRGFYKFLSTLLSTSSRFSLASMVFDMFNLNHFMCTYSWKMKINYHLTPAFGWTSSQKYYLSAL